MTRRRVTTRLRPALPIALIGMLLFYVSGAALLTHMAVAHPEQWASPSAEAGHETHRPSDDAPPPYDHSRSCEAGHMLHGIAASVPPEPSLPPVTLAIERLAPEGDRFVPVTSHLQFRSRAPPPPAA